MVKEQGISVLTARKVATRINSSTMPIYSYFKTIDELKREVMQRAVSILWEYMDGKYDETIFFNMGIGYILFSRDNPQLFKALFLETIDYQDIIDDFTNAAIVRMGHDTRFVSWSLHERRLLFHKIYIFTHGYATMLCIGNIRNESNENIISLIDEVGRTIIISEFSKKGE